MRSVAAQSLNELFQAYLFQVAVTFHGGDNLIGFAWGDPQHCEGQRDQYGPCSNGARTADHEAMQALGTAMRDIAGDVHEGLYSVGTMNEVIYPVNGGMEDWAYGGSWNGAHTVCEPHDDEYPKERTVYSDAALRCPMFLVETARRKEPPEADLGDTGGLREAGAAGDGHVPRNLRLAALAVEMVQPYVVLHPVSPKALPGTTLRVTWHVGGSARVDETRLEWRVVQQGQVAVWLPAGEPHEVAESAEEKGMPFWRRSPQGAFWGSRTFATDLVLSEQQGITLEIRARARVDEAWAHGEAESHLVNARTNPAWSHHHANFTVQGQQHWLSGSVRLIIDLAEGGGAQVERPSERMQEGLPRGNAPPGIPEAGPPGVALPPASPPLDLGLTDLQKAEEVDGAQAWPRSQPASAEAEAVSRLSTSGASGATISTSGAPSSATSGTMQSFSTGRETRRDGSFSLQIFLFLAFVTLTSLFVRSRWKGNFGNAAKGAVRRMANLKAGNPRLPTNCDI